MWRLIFPTLSCVLFAAHVLFHGFGFLAAALCIVLAVIFWIPNAVAAHIGATILAIMGAEWVRAGMMLAMWRMEMGRPWMVALMILLLCALWTWFTAWLLYRPKLRERWR